MEREQCDYCGKTELEKDNFVCCELGGMVCPDCNNDLTQENEFPTP